MKIKNVNKYKLIYLLTFNNNMGISKIFIHYSLINDIKNKHSIEDCFKFVNNNIIIYVPRKNCNNVKIINNQVCFENINSNEFVEISEQSDNY